MREVELRPAYAWDCEECGRQNFANGICPDLSEEDVQELRDDHGIQPWEVGTWQMMPTVVKCEHCGSEFKTLHYGDSDDE